MSREDPTFEERVTGGLSNAVKGFGLAYGVEAATNFYKNTLSKTKPATPLPLISQGYWKTALGFAAILGAWNFIFRKGANERNDIKKASREAGSTALNEVRQRYEQGGAPAQDSTKFRDMVTTSRAQVQDLNR